MLLFLVAWDAQLINKYVNAVACSLLYCCYVAVSCCSGRATGKKMSKNNIFPTVFLRLCVHFFKYLAPSGDIAKKGRPLRELTRGDRETYFGTFNFWVKHFL